jgi:hypothetical protein
MCAVPIDTVFTINILASTTIVSSAVAELWFFPMLIIFNSSHNCNYRPSPPVTPPLLVMPGMPVPGTARVQVKRPGALPVTHDVN